MKTQPKHDALTKSAVGSLFGVSYVAIGQWVHAGCPIRPDNKLDLKEVIKWREGWWKAKIKEEGSSGSDALEEWRRCRAEMAQIDLAAKRGEYVKIGDATAWWVDRTTEARTALMSFGQAIGPAIQGLPAREVQRICDERLRAICENLQREWQASCIASEVSDDDDDGE